MQDGLNLIDQNPSYVQWIKLGRVDSIQTIEQGTLFLYGGCFLVFVEAMPHYKEIVYYADGPGRGDGVQCASVHPSLPCFAFAEKVKDPRILVVMYPDFKIIKVIPRTFDTIYSSIAFNELEYLVTISEKMNGCQLIVWNWRSCEQICCGNSTIADQHQIIRVSQCSPLRIAQGSSRGSTVCIWECFPCCNKKTFLNKNLLKFPINSVAPFSFAWNLDGDLLVIDSRGSLLTVDLDTYECTQEYNFQDSEENISPKSTPFIVPYKLGILVCHRGNVFHMSKKKSDCWQTIWTTNTHLQFNLLIVTPNESIFCWTSQHVLATLKVEKSIEYQAIKNYGCNFDHTCVIHPADDHFMSINTETQSVSLWDIVSGEHISQTHFEAKSKVTCVAASPILPLAIICFNDGCFHGLNAYHTDNIKIILGLFLTRSSLNIISFSNVGAHFCLATKSNGGIFILNMSEGNTFDVIAGTEFGYDVTDVVYKEQEGIEEGELIVSLMNEKPSCKIFKVDFKEKSFDLTKTVHLEENFPHMLFSPLNDGFIALTSNSMKIFFLNATGNVVRSLNSGHLICPISIKLVGKELLTYGKDGLVILHTSQSNYAEMKTFYVHPRYDGGVLNIDADAGVRFILSRGVDGSLICSRTGFDFLSDTIREGNCSFIASEKIKELFRPKENVESEPGLKESSIRKSEDIETECTWLEYQEHLKMEKIKEEHIEEQMKVKNDLKIVKEKLKSLLDANEICSEEEKLPVSAFELNPAGRTNYMRMMKNQLGETHKLELERIKARDEVSNHILTSLWHKMAVHSKQLRGFNVDVVVESYSLEPEDPSAQVKMDLLQQRLRLVRMLHDGDFFQPWVPRNDNDLREHINETFLSTGSADFASKFTKSIAEVDDRVEELARTWSGTTSYQFIEVSENHLDQLHIATNEQIKQEIELIQWDIRMLMAWFNGQFDSIYSKKESKLKAISDWKARLRTIVKELEFFNCPCDLKVEDIKEYTWTMREKPEKVIVVEEHELENKSYISKAQKEQQAYIEAEAEVKRQRLLADNFKQVALDNMMDGVLERLWHEEIKKDIKIPTFMVEKEDPESWTDEEKKKAKNYSEAVEQLEIERVRYQKLLGVEMEQITVSIQDSSTKFDQEIAILYELKLRVESAVCQEQLKILRMRKRMQEKIGIGLKEREIRENIELAEKRLGKQQEEVSKLLEVLAESKVAYENFMAKDKNFDKSFRKDFPEYSPVICEQLLKLSKKRPRLTGNGTSCITFLNEMGHALVLNSRPEGLPPECLEFLKGIDTLDSALNTPAVVSEMSWDILCRLRRTKIESELKARALSLEIAETEGTVATWQRSIKICKETLAKLEAELQTLREEKMYQYHNLEVQLVVKQGLVEIGLTGMMSDFENSVMITRSDVLCINQEIKLIGKQKISAMQKGNELRKIIALREWEHKKLRMRIEDLDSTLDTLEHVTVTKELKDILAARARGDYSEKGFSHLEKEIASVKERFEKSKSELLKKISEYDSKINDLTRKNADLDKKIVKLNSAVGEKTLLRDIDKEKSIDNQGKQRMRNILYRKRLCVKIEEQEREIGELAAELDMLRRRTYPAIHHKAD